MRKCLIESGCIRIWTGVGVSINEDIKVWGLALCVSRLIYTEQAPWLAGDYPESCIMAGISKCL